MKNIIIILLLCLINPLFIQAEQTSNKKEITDNIQPKNTKNINSITGKSADKENSPENVKFGFSPTPEIKFLPLVTKVFFLLVIIIVLFYFVRKIFGKKNINVSDNNGLFEILAVLQLTPDKKIYFTEIVDEIYILGVTEKNINLITKITDKEKIDNIKLISEMNVSGKNKNNFMKHMINSFSKDKEYDVSDFKTIDDFK